MALFHPLPFFAHSFSKILTPSQQTCTHFLSVGARTGGVAGVGSEVFYYVTDVNYMPSVNASAWGITGSCVLLINKYPFGQCLGGAALATMVSLAMSLLLEGNAIRGATRGFEKMDMQGVRPDSLQDMAQRRQFHLYKAAVSETRQFSATNTYSMVYGGTVHIDDYRDENGIVDYTKYWDAYSDAWLDWFSGIDPKAKANAPEVPDHRQAELVRRMGSLVDKHRD